MKTQTEQILDHLKNGYSLTSLEALQRFNSLRLGSIIHHLRNKGWAIKTDIIETKTNKRVAMYTLTDFRECGDCYYFIGEDRGSCKYKSIKITKKSSACEKFKER